MMEENNRKGPGIFYAVVGVATLVVAIIGATFAYFSASKEDATTVTGEAATAGLSLLVEKVSKDATGGLIPVGDGTATDITKFPNVLDKAIVGENSKICVDKDGNTACQLYRITVTNTGNAPTRLEGTLTLTATGYTNLKWANINMNEGLTTDAVPTSAGSNLNASGDTSITTNELYAGSQVKYYYVLVYIAETGASQNETDKGSFTGVVKFNSAGGTGTTATFTA